MKNKNNHGFKVGDKVYTVKNSSWGMVPMTVKSVESNAVVCQHKDFSTVGWFRSDECKLVNTVRSEELFDLQYAMNEVSRLKHELFGE